MSWPTHTAQITAGRKLLDYLQSISHYPEVWRTLAQKEGWSITLTFGRLLTDKERALAEFASEVDVDTDHITLEFEINDKHYQPILTRLLQSTRT